MSDSRKVSLIIKFLPITFALHNLEEALSISYFQQIVQTPLTVDPRQFIIAVSLFTVLGFLLVFGKKFYSTEQSYQYVIVGFSGMLFLNSFFPHILSLLIYRSYSPGLITAIFLLLPHTSYLLPRIYMSKQFSRKQFLTIIFIGGFIGLALVFLFLGIGLILTH